MWASHSAAQGFIVTRTSRMYWSACTDRSGASEPALFPEAECISQQPSPAQIRGVAPRRQGVSPMAAGYHAAIA